MSTVKMPTAQTFKKFVDMLDEWKPDAATDWNEFFQVRTRARDSPMAKPCQLLALGSAGQRVRWSLDHFYCALVAADVVAWRLSIDHEQVLAFSSS